MEQIICSGDVMYLKKISLFTLGLAVAFHAVSADNASSVPSKIENKINITKTKLEFNKNQKSDFVTVINKSENEAFGFSVQVYKWSQVNGKDEMEKSENIIAAPKTFVLQPKQYKNIRLVADNYPQAVKDYSYRLVLSQISRETTKELNQDGQSKLKINLTITIPIFFYSEAFKEHDKLNIESYVDNAAKSVVIKNNDNQHIFLKKIKIDEQEYTHNWYILPNSKIVTKLPKMENKPNHKLELVTDRTVLIK